MRNPTRTTKPERRAARRHSPMISRHLGIAAAARLRRAGAIMNDGDALDRLGHVFAIVADPMPFDLNERVTQALEQSRLRLAIAMDVPPEHITPSYVRADTDTRIDLEQPAGEAPRPINPEYARLFVEEGWSTVGAVPENFEPWESAEAIAPTGAIPATFECEGWELSGPITPTEEERAEADRVLEDLRGAGVLKYPRSMAIMSDNVCIEPALHDAMADMLAEPDTVTDATPAIITVSTCIECGTEFEGTGDICSAGCGHALTGEYPPTYEKDYGDE